jgi:hypothetical protein
MPDHPDLPRHKPAENVAPSVSLDHLGRSVAHNHRPGTVVAHAISGVRCLDHHERIGAVLCELRGLELPRFRGHPIVSFGSREGVLDGASV